MALKFPPEFPFHRNVAQSTPEAVEGVETFDLFDEVPPADSGVAPRRRTAPQLVIASAAPVGQDRRRSPRQTLVAKATIRPDTAVTMPSLTTAGFVSNISMNGVGFHTKKPLAVGEKYRITLELGPMKWSSRLRVVTCRHHDESETFDVGAEFVGNELNRLAA